MREARLKGGRYNGNCKGDGKGKMPRLRPRRYI